MSPTRRPWLIVVALTAVPLVAAIFYAYWESPRRTIALLGLALVVAVVAWHRVGSPRLDEPDGIALRSLWPVLLPTALALFWWFNEERRRGATLATLALVLLVVLVAGIDLAKYVRRVVDGVGAVLAGLLYALTVLPAWVISRIRRRDPLRGRTSRPVWSTVRADTQPRSMGTTRPRAASRRTMPGRITWAVGAVVVVVALNYGLGYLWDQVTEQAAPAAPTTQNAPPPRVAAGVTGPVPRDPRQDLPAMADYPWRATYFDEVQRTPGTYWPFTEYRPLSYHSEYVNIDDWVRQSYEPAGDTDDLPEVWFFGGSTAFGEGQRDDYTIASWISRLAEEYGLPITVRNYGQRGWTHFQEMILYEQELATNPAPAVGLFYDGANEITAQSLMTEAVPTHTLALAYVYELFGTRIVTEVAPPEQEPATSEVLGDAWDAYTRHSLAHELTAWLGLTAEGAEAQTPDGDEDEDEVQLLTRGFETDQIFRPDGAVDRYNVTPSDGRDAAQVYERGRALTLALSRDHGVAPLLFWQPVGRQTDSDAMATEQIDEPTIDLSHVLDDHEDVFIDGAHHNEEGARIVAEAIWPELRPLIERWYEEHG